MEPVLVTDPKLADVLHELIKLEAILHHPGSGKSCPDFKSMTDPAFWEVGASGRRYSREYILDVLEQRHKHPVEEIWEAQDFHCLEIAPDNYLVTYTLKQMERVTRRSSVWRRSDHNWKIVYHQGTVVANI